MSNESWSYEISESRLLMDFGMFFDDLRWVVRFLVDVKWDVVGLGIRHVCTVGKVESDVEEIDDFFVGFNCNFKAMLTEDGTQIFLD